MKLRHVKTVCQHTFVLEDDAGDLTEQVSDLVTVNAKDWPGYAKQLEAERVEQEKALTEGGA